MRPIVHHRFSQLRLRGKEHEHVHAAGDSASTGIILVSNTIAAVLALVLIAVLLAAAATIRHLIHRLAPRGHLHAALKWLYNHPDARDAGLAIIVYVPLVLVLVLSSSYTHDVTYNRFAWVALAHFVAATVLGGAFSPLAWVLDRHTLLRYHAFFARVGVVLITVHMALHIHLWQTYDLVSTFLWDRASMVYGLFAWMTVAAMALSSLPWVRQRVYALFVVAHHVLVMLLLALVVMHRPATVPMVLAMAVFLVGNKLAVAYMAMARSPARVDVRDSPYWREAASNTVTRSPRSTHASRPRTRSTCDIPLLSPTQATTPGESGAASSSVVAVRLVPAEYASLAVGPGQVVYLATPPVPIFHPYSPHAIASTTALASSASSLAKSVGAEVWLDARSKFASRIRASERVFVIVPPAPQPVPVAEFDDVWFIAGGMGITPVVAWLEAMKGRETPGRVLGPTCDIPLLSPTQATTPGESGAASSSVVAVRLVPAEYASLAVGPGQVVYLATPPVPIFHPYSPHAIASTTALASSASSLAKSVGAEVWLDARSKFASRIRASERVFVIVPPAPQPVPVAEFDDVWFIAGGMGITPVVAWLEAMKGRETRVMVLWVVNEDRGEMVDWVGYCRSVPGLKVKVFTTGGEGGKRPDWEVEVPKDMVSDMSFAFVCGPPALCAAVRKLDRPWWIHVEAFGW
ncbi:hypothetical protein AMAG_00070 [Allomyces macrogynus ATCC 38327]|uniref:Ferric oxidoreductase domain-containing protein n=1 Tax=Allomyces macrogynus (strain ATCC 38327) TaxID=578462 RepID=A0A0L0RUL5_ALLM3|nr:hypothetical protein AMAG_00070 [Allomyces macrogynus ATCC 38327]|eukprot:KNE54067.1 hypothetical protein AMAG_00070 [Allomyces macrogynus ATCC 38327]